jgi:hypothetical protein
VALLVASGMKNAEIAAILATTQHVIKNLLREVYDRSGCSNRVELALLVVHEAELGVYDPENFGRELCALLRFDDHFAVFEVLAPSQKCET